jgi:hypothetical protein
VTRSTNARIAGIIYFVYLAAGVASLVLAGRAHARDVAFLFTSFSALVLGVTLYACSPCSSTDSRAVADRRHVYWLWRLRGRRSDRGKVRAGAPRATAMAEV